MRNNGFLESGLARKLFFTPQKNVIFHRIFKDFVVFTEQKLEGDDIVVYTYNLDPWFDYAENFQEEK